ncbi:MAG TPA: PA14 domain-containing protein, partial [Thermoanaerobaculia bacterium]|nr:PA14 domain-containing protein [Thermoanaerobaculia bacterium]
DRPPGGLYGVVSFETDKKPQHRLDGTIATGGLSEEIVAEGHPYQAVWTGTLAAPETGTYRMGLLAEGEAELTLDGRVAVRVDPAGGETKSAEVALTAGPHPVTLTFRKARGSGALQWTWKPPSADGETIVPPSVLTPPPGAGVGPALSADVLGPRERPRIEPQGVFRR